MKLLNPIFNWYYHIYLFQLDEYDAGLYLSGLKRLVNPPQTFRKSVKWTGKLLILEILSWTIVLLLISLIYFLGLSAEYLTTASLLLILLYLYFHFIFLIAANLFFSPVDSLVKNIIIGKAQKRLTKYPDLKIVGIAGSYGKTTMKEMLASVLSVKYQVLKTPENINTPVGISRLILQKLKPETEIFIVEMGEYYPGDITRICRITPPDVAVVTGINEAHLSRMISLTNTSATIFEVVDNLKSGGRVFLNADDKNVTDWAGKHEYQNLKWYGYGPSKLCFYNVKNQSILDEWKGQRFTVYKNTKAVLKVETKLLAGYAAGNAVACYEIASFLGMSRLEIEKGLNLTQPVEHRLQPIYNQQSDILVIDDSYNGNPDGIREAIKVLSGFKKRRKIYITPGLVEAGTETEKTHLEIGRMLAKVADLVILVKNSVTPMIAKGLRDSGYNPDQIIWYSSASQLHGGFNKYLKRGDIVLFQNDWPDNYI